MKRGKAGSKRVTAEQSSLKSAVQDEARAASNARDNLKSSFSIVEGDRAITESSLLDRVASAAHSGINILASVTSRRIEKTKQVMITSSEKIQNGRSNFTARQQRLTVAIRSEICNKPLSAIGVALIVGIIFEKLTAKRR